MSQRIKKYHRPIVWMLVVAMQHAAIAPALAAPPIPSLPKPATNNSSYTQAGTVGTVNQSKTKQVFNWKSFDIGNGYKVVFNQPNGGAALNKVADNGRPSEIRGVLQSVTPDGKGGAIYLINQNGIIFGSTAQVNVGSLIASQLNISDSNFENYSLAEIMGKLGQPAFEVFVDGHGNPILKEITTESGAKIHSSGLEGVKIFAADITNAGTIETPEGQALLAASKGKVYLTAPATPGGVTPQLAGFLVEVDTGGNVNNVGHIVAERGNITLMGMAINQNGRLNATTAAGVSGNGSIRLLARDGGESKDLQASIYSSDNERNNLARGPLVGVLTRDANHINVAQSGCLSGTVCTGTVIFGKNSVTEISPDNSSAPQPTSVNQNPSVVEVMGKTIELQENALIHATGGVVQITATSNPDAPQPGGEPGSTITLGKNSKIDVSGASVEKSLQDNVVAAKLVGANLADVPVQRNGALNRADVLVDARLGTKVANVSGEIAAMAHSASERLSTGGSVKLSGGGAVTIDSNAKIDVSGGKVTYASGDKTTTYVHGGGSWKEISQADPNVYYDNVKNIVAHNAPGYVEGKNAGNIEINTRKAPAIAASVIKGGVTAGVYQRDKNTAPKAGTLTLNLKNGDSFSGNKVNIVTQQAYKSSPGQIVDQLFANSGLSDVIINTGGDLNVINGANILLADGGKFAVNTTVDTNPTAINIDGVIHIVGGSVALNNQKNTGQIANTITLGSNASIDASGLWINERLDSSSVTPHFIDGGSIDFRSGSLFLNQGSKLISNGGALYDNKAKLTAGKGGSIALATNYAAPTQLNTVAAARLQLDSTLSAYALGQGGTLSLTHNGFVLGNNGIHAAQRDLLLTPDYFRRGGFSAYNLTSTLDGIRVANNTLVDLRADNWAISNNKLFTQKTGASISTFVATTTLPDYLRKPVDLNLIVQSQPSQVANLVTAPTLSIEAGASINADPGANIALSSKALQILIDGTVKALGGNIAVTLGGAAAGTVDYSAGYRADQAIVLGSNALLDTSATFVEKPQINHSSMRDYAVYDAGKISLNANNGYIVAEKGSRLHVDGAAQQIDVRQYTSSSQVTQSNTNVAADAGTLHLQAAEGMLLDAEMSGKAVNVGGAKGGRLEVVLDNNLAKTRLNQSGVDDVPDASTLHLTQTSIDNGSSKLILRGSNGQIEGVRDIRATLTAPNAVIAKNSALLSVNKINSGGFDSLQLTSANTGLYDINGTNLLGHLSGSINIDSDLSLSLRQSLELNTNSIAIDGVGNAKLSAGYVAWSIDPNNVLLHDYANDTTSGNGILTLAGNFIDLIGKLTTTGIKQTTLQSTGDIRARDILNGSSTNILSEGSLTTAGNLTLQAQQIYPPTAHHFNFNVLGFNVQGNNPTAKLTILPQSGTPGAILSAGGSLAFNAPNIEQNGVVKAPLGSIAMTATNNLTLGVGSTTSIALDTLVPYGVVDNNGKWSINLPQKNIVLQAPNQTIANGAVVDISGGGEVYEYQFIAGPGGSKDVLAQSPSSFAIVPTLSLAYAPLDTLDSSMQMPDGWSQGQVVSLNMNGSVQTYTVLPARYAMLPGALLIAPATQYNGLAPGSSFTLTDGTQIVAGKMGYAPQGSDDTPLIQDSVWSAFAVQTRDQVFDRSEYRLQYGSKQGESTSTSNRPQDAGSLQLLAQTSAIFAGELRAAGADGGHGGKLDILANDIAVVKTPSAGSHSGLEILDSQLNGLSSVESIFLGGTRNMTNSGTQLSVAANTVRIAENAVLNVQELLLAAKDKITVAAGAIVSASGARNPQSEAEAINVSGDGVVLRLSSVNQANIQRSGANTSSTQGSIELNASAQLHATKAIAVDVTQGADLAGTMDANGGSLAFSAPQISIGGGSSGLLLRADQLRNINDANHPDFQQLILNSSTNLDFYSGVNVNADDLQIGAANLRSFANTTDTVSLNANQALTLTGRGNAGVGASGNNGQLQISARNIVLNGGKEMQQTLALNNFNNQTVLTASDKIVAQNKLGLDVGGAVNIVSPMLTAANGAVFSLQSSDAVAITGGSGTSGVAAGTFGNITVNAKTAHIDTAVVLPSGHFAINAEGTNGVAGDDIVIGSSSNDATHNHAIIDVAGRKLTIGDQVVETDGGSINFTATNGNIVATANSQLTVSAGGNNTDAGSIDILAAKGNAQLDAQVAGNAAANHSGGGFSLDSNSISGFSQLLQRLNSFNNSITVRLRSGDLAIGAQDHVTAHQIDIETDNGKLDITGTLDASGGSGGSILLAAGNDLNVQSTANIDAHATTNNGDGGDVTLVSKNGFMNLQDGSAIVVGGNGTGKNGSVALQVSRTEDGVITQTVNDGTGDDGANGLALTHFGSQISGAKNIDVIGIRHYATTTISSVIDTIKTDTQTFMASIDNWKQQIFGNNMPNNVRIMPGVDIYNNDSNSDLSVDTSIDLFDNGSGAWRYGHDSATPGLLSLRASGNLKVSAPVSDGFFTDTSLGTINDSFACFIASCSGLANGSSWSFHAVAGADMNAANIGQVIRGKDSDLLLDASSQFDPFTSQPIANLIRSGTGDIKVAAARDIVFGDGLAAIYSSGIATSYKTQSNSTSPVYGYDGVNQLAGFFATGLPEYPLDGGNVSVSAGRNISVMTSNNLPAQSSSWLLRIGDEVYPATWGVAPTLFGGGVAALGGGNVTVAAGKDINYLQVAAPTTGKQVGEILAADGSPKSDAAEFSKIDVHGGGNVTVNAGGNIASSSFLVDGGKGVITAGGGLVQAQGAPVANLIGIGDAKVTIKAHDSIVTEAIYNPTVFFQNDDALNKSEFLTYTPSSSVSVFAATGDVVLKNDIDNLKSSYVTWPAISDGTKAEAANTLSRLLPANVTATAAVGSIVFGNSITLLPDANSNLTLFAGIDIRSNDSINAASILLPDGDATSLPMLHKNSQDNFYRVVPINSLIPADIQLNALIADAHAATPVHTNDMTTMRISAGRDISNLVLSTPKAANIVAGRDIVNNIITIQNLHSSDVSQIVAGRDIALTGSNSLKTQISGPGRLDILAGRDVDLGNAVNGVKSIGSSENPVLGVEPAATISVLAGLGNIGLNYDGFIQKYILNTDALVNYVTSSRFGGDVVAYVSTATGVNYSDRDMAIDALKNLATSSPAGKTQALGISQNIYLAATRAQQRELVLNTYFNELKQGGIEAQEKTGEGIARSYRAIDMLFPHASAANQLKQLAARSSSSTSDGYAGDIRLTQSVIQGFGDGNINLIAPGGSVDVGLPVAAQTNNDVVQGIVIGGKGSINAYVRDSINVNRSRIIVQNGGDILGFARFGDIDAGRGSRTKLTLPPPQLTQDSNGNLLLVSAAALSGSGIQAGCSASDCKGGDVFLFAPNGIIDAGDAGIASKGNIFLLANQVLHADVINAAGTITGAPAAPAITIGLGAGDVAASAVQSAQELAANAASGTDQSPLGQRGLALLTVDILGYGSSQDDDEKRKRH
jgi:filamentous hemagglutinin